MGRRGGTTRAYCAEEGCRETTFWEHETARDRRAHEARLARSPWRCVRHTNPGRNLSAENPLRVTEIVAKPSERHPELDDLYWHGDVLTSRSTGGAGWRAYTQDFPEGSRVVEVAVVVAPGDDRDLREILAERLREFKDEGGS